MSCYYYNGELYHHGISGQKWGVRNGPPYPLDSGSTTSSKTKRKLDTGKVTSKIKSTVNSAKNKISESRSSSKEKKEAKKLQSKKISDLSDAELQKVVNRMKLENKYYKESSDLKKNTTSKGKEYINKAKNKLVNAAFDTVTDKAAEKIKKSVSEMLSSKKQDETTKKENTKKESTKNNKNTDKKDNKIKIENYSNKYKLNDYNATSTSAAKEFVDSLGEVSFTSAYQTANTTYSVSANKVNSNAVDALLKANNIEYRKKK